MEYYALHIIMVLFLDFFLGTPNWLTLQSRGGSRVCKGVEKVKDQKQKGEAGWVKEAALKYIIIIVAQINYTAYDWFITVTD